MRYTSMWKVSLSFLLIRGWPHDLAQELKIILLISFAKNNKGRQAQVLPISIYLAGKASGTVDMRPGTE